MNGKKCMFVALILTAMLLAVWFRVGEKRGPATRPSEAMIVQPVAVPVNQVADEGQFQRLREECEHAKRELADANAKVVALTVANEKAETLNASLAEQAWQAEAKMEKMAGTHEARTRSLHSWLTVVSIAGVVGFFVGISMGSSARRAFVAAKGGRP